MIEIIADPALAHHVEYARHMQAGFGCHGIQAPILAPWEPSVADVVVCWGWRLGEPLRAAGRRVLVMERGYLGDRSRWTSLGWDGLNGRAEFAFVDDGLRFWRYFGRELHDIDTSGGYALLIGQVAGDAALAGADIESWYAETAARAAVAFGLPVRFRPHPLGGAPDVPGAPALDGTLDDALAGAAVVITFSSTTGVAALLRGKPTIAADCGSMAWPIAAHELRIEAPAGREAWAERLAWCQFTRDDIRSGYAWDIVRTAM